MEIVRELTVRGHQIRVAHRPGAGRPLVMCNGIGAGLDLLQPFVDELDPSIPVVRFDVPGVGGSPVPRKPYVFATLVSLMGSMLDQLEYRDVDVLGISWGGGLAQQFAFQNPRRCRRLVLVSTASGWMMVPAHPRVLAKMITPKRYRDPDYAKSIAAEIYGGVLREKPELAKTLLNGHSPIGSRRGYVMQLLAATGWTSTPFLPLIRQPTLILAGLDDPIIPLVNARMMARLMPHAVLETYDDGHLGLVVKAEVLAPRVTAFLRHADQLS